MKNKKLFIISCIFILIAIIIPVIIISMIIESISNYIDDNEKDEEWSYHDLNIISSTENEDLEDIVLEYGRKNGYDINIDYAGTLEIMQKLNDKEWEGKYDAVWISNSIWLYMLENSSLVQESKCTSINPIVFGITKSKAESLGFIEKEVYTKEIVNAISSGLLKFSMSNPTSTNSGASAYLGLLSTLAGNPEVLKEEHLENEELKINLISFFKGLERSSGSEAFLEEMFLNGDYEAVFTYESSIININAKLEQQGKETLYAIYPIDGISISDSPLGFIDNGFEYKKDVFTNLQKYILSDEGQKLLQEHGRRTWYGGINKNVDKNIFNPEWGINTEKYITPVKFPSTKVIKYALNLYQTEFRKPVHVVFCLDYSGSMYGVGYEELKKAMNYILTDEAANDLLQFSSKDKIDIIPFSTYIDEIFSTDDGSKTEELLQNISLKYPGGNTALYPAAQKALEIINDEDEQIYNISIILMTDGKANIGKFKDLKLYYNSMGKNIPIYSIMFGNAVESELEEIARLTNAKVFDGKIDLKKAFKEVRGYN